ncbi:MAG: T9SS type A sorting domain-containing protein [Bacteroidota bacterium]
MTRSLLFLLFLIPILSSAQEFTTDGNTWTQTGEDLVANRFPFYLSTDGDTTISGQTYRRVFAQDEVYLPTPTYVGAIRELDDKIYVVPAENTPAEEFLIYDWQAQAGDTLSAREFSWVVVDEIIDFTLLNGATKKQFNCSRYRVQFGADTVRLPLTIIEDIGCVDYTFLLDPFFDIPSGSFGDLFASPESVRCFSNNEELLWQDPNIQSCNDIIAGQQDLLPSIDYRIAPNPVRDQIQLYGPISRFPLVLDLRLYDARGRLNQRWPETLLAWPRALDVSNVPPGMYTLQIIEKGQEAEPVNIKLIKL